MKRMKKIAVVDYYSQQINQIDIDTENSLQKISDDSIKSINRKKRLNLRRNILIDEIKKCEKINLDKLESHALELDDDSIFQERFCYYYKRRQNNIFGILLIFNFFIPERFFRNRKSYIPTIFEENILFDFVRDAISQIRMYRLSIVDFTKKQNTLRKVTYLNQSNRTYEINNLIVRGLTMHSHGSFINTYSTSNLLELFYENCVLEQTYFKFFCRKMKKLKSLSLINCEISSLVIFSLKDFTNLKILNLSDNKIKLFSSYQFYGLDNLEVLNLTSNSIDYLYRQFIILKNLRILNLSKNNLKNINYDDFKELNNLEELDLSNCSIENIDPTAFSQLHNLSYLNISCNRISQLNIIKSGLGFPNLKYLNTGLNFLNNINFLGVFDRLEYLDLIQIQEHIPSTGSYLLNNVFLPNLKFLECDCNFMPTFDFAKIQGLVIVGLLDLNKYFIDQCISLDYLELSFLNGSSIDKLSRDTFKCLDKRIRYLKLKFFTVNSREILNKLNRLITDLGSLFNVLNLEKKLYGNTITENSLGFIEIKMANVQKTQYFENILNVSASTRRAILNIDK
ncbi:unnamed protein product [Brachionus calyciflorus]|uniref:Uncharacterized protein n=1 Tax=Brachionus calyciflorus TaxID=104777 RepID=A0A813TPJ8_9BILA|nr:unnamed protein product [Brachionus calyciflorus]